jgi:flagellar assembly protein FliH
MTASPARFTFDLDLRQSQGRAAFVSEAGIAAQLQQARLDAHASGFAEGERSATALAAQQLAAAAAGIASRADAMFASLDDARRTAEREAIELAASIARKLAASLLAAQPAAELETLLAECLATLDGVPHLVVRCHPDLVEPLQQLAAPKVAASGFTGRLIVMGDPEQRPGDGRIEWADGGLVRDAAVTAAEIDARIANYLAARAARPLGEPQP